MPRSNIELAASLTRLLAPKDAHSIYGPPFTPSWLERKRREGGGPPFLKTGTGRTAKIYYRVSDVEEWIEAHMRKSTSDSGDTGER